MAHEYFAGFSIAALLFQNVAAGKIEHVAYCWLQG
jgi:hypothetical protein